MRLEDRLKSLENQAAASKAASLLPTQPLKMEVVSEVAAAAKAISAAAAEEVVVEKAKVEELKPTTSARFIVTTGGPPVASVQVVTNPNVASIEANNASARQNLDSIVEAIRHLEGDHLFSEGSSHKVTNLKI